MKDPVTAGGASPCEAPAFDLETLQQESHEQLRKVHDLQKGGTDPEEDLIYLKGSLEALRSLQRNDGSSLPGVFSKIYYVEAGSADPMLRCKTLIHRTAWEAEPAPHSDVRVHDGAFELELVPPDSPRRVGGDVLFVLFESSGPGECTFYGQCLVPIRDLAAAADWSRNESFEATRRAWLPLLDREGRAVNATAAELQLSIYVPVISRWRQEDGLAAQGTSQRRKRAARRATSGAPTYHKAWRVDDIKRENDRLRARIRSIRGHKERPAPAHDAELEAAADDSDFDMRVEMVEELMAREQVKKKVLDTQRALQNLREEISARSMRQRRLQHAVEKYTLQFTNLTEQVGHGNLKSDEGAVRALLDDIGQTSVFLGADDEDGVDQQLLRSYTSLKEQHMRLFEQCDRHEQRILIAREELILMKQKIHRGIQRQNALFAKGDAAEAIEAHGIREQCIAMKAKVKQLQFEEDQSLTEWQDLEEERDVMHDEIAAMQSRVRLMESRYEECNSALDSARERFLAICRQGKEFPYRMHIDKLKHLSRLAGDTMWQTGRSPAP